MTPRSGRLSHLFLKGLALCWGPVYGVVGTGSAPEDADVEIAKGASVWPLPRPAWNQEDMRSSLDSPASSGSTRWGQEVLQRAPRLPWSPVTTYCPLCVACAPTCWSDQTCPLA